MKLDYFFQIMSKCILSLKKNELNDRWPKGQILQQILQNSSCLDTVRLYFPASLKFSVIMWLTWHKTLTKRCMSLLAKRFKRLEKNHCLLYLLWLLWKQASRWVLQQPRPLLSTIRRSYPPLPLNLLTYKRHGMWVKNKPLFIEITHRDFLLFLL